MLSHVSGVRDYLPKDLSRRAWLFEPPEITPSLVRLASSVIKTTPLPIRWFTIDLTVVRGQYDNLNKRKLIPEPRRTGNILVCGFRAMDKHVIEIAELLRERGKNVVVYPKPHITKALKYADRSGIAHVVMLFPDEWNRGYVLVRTMNTSHETTVNIEALASVV